MNKAQKLAEMAVKNASKPASSYPYMPLANLMASVFGGYPSVQNLLAVETGYANIAAFMDDLAGAADFSDKDLAAANRAAIKHAKRLKDGVPFVEEDHEWADIVATDHDAGTLNLLVAAND